MAYEREKMYPEDGSNGLPVGDERTEASQKHSELLKWHLDELKIQENSLQKNLD